MNIREQILTSCRAVSGCFVHYPSPDDLLLAASNVEFIVKGFAPMALVENLQRIFAIGKDRAERVHQGSDQKLQWPGVECGIALGAKQMLALVRDRSILPSI